ncbi:hypothetical protein ACCS70_28585 [Rhizobium ruizarguesonis]|uniref:hypothetical protein n=1 Tax=Rhizobium ruizarguesonis TaxID=2081791 RepID=UPI001FDED61E|nr:hypothetical protein [Rhizobium ruizarguesonis]
MTDNSKSPPAKKTIQDPPEYTAAPEEPSQAAPSSSLDKMPPWSIPGAENLQIEDPVEIPLGDWLGGPQNGEEATYQQNGQQVVVPTGTGDQAKETAGTKGWLGGPQNGAEAPASNVDHEVDDRGRVPTKEKKAPKGSLSGGVDQQQGGGPDVG